MSDHPFPVPSAFEQAVTQAREELDNYKKIKSNLRESFEKWSDDNGHYEDENYYMQGSQTRRHYNEDMWLAWQGHDELFMHIGYVPIGSDKIVQVEGFLNLTSAGIPCSSVFKII